MTISTLEVLLGLFGLFITAAFIMPSLRRQLDERTAKEREQPINLYRLHKQLSSHDYLP